MESDLTRIISNWQTSGQNDGGREVVDAAFDNGISLGLMSSTSIMGIEELSPAPQEPVAQQSCGLPEWEAV